MKPQDLPVTSTWEKRSDCFSRTLLNVHLTDLTQLRAQTYLHFISRHAFTDHMFNPHVSLNLTEQNQTALKTAFWKFSYSQKTQWFPRQLHVVNYGTNHRAAPLISTLNSVIRCFSSLLTLNQTESSSFSEL